MGVKIYHAGFTISTKEIEKNGILLCLYDLYVHLCVKFGIMLPAPEKPHILLCRSHHRRAINLVFQDAFRHEFILTNHRA